MGGDPVYLFRRVEPRPWWRDGDFYREWVPIAAAVVVVVALWCTIAVS
jgi:hypothetical protein